MTDVSAAEAAAEEEARLAAAESGDRDDEGQQQQQADNEARARRMGWIPEEEFDDATMERKPAKFLSADEYIEKVENDLPILRERNRHMNKTIKGLEDKLTDATDKIGSAEGKIDELTDLVGSLHKQNVEVGKRAYERAKKEIDSQMEQAVEDGDTERYKRLRDDRDELEAAKPPETPETPAKTDDTTQKKKDDTEPELSKVAKDWIKNNDAIMGDPKLNPVAVGLHAANMAAGMDEAASLADVKKEIMTRYPEKFENPARRDPPPVETPGGQNNPGGDKKKGFDSLPAEVKQTYEQLKVHYETKGHEYTKEQYAKDYYLELEA